MLKFQELTNEENAEETLEKICKHIANGGSIIDWCEAHEVSWASINWWLNDKESGRDKKYIEAIVAQTEWAIQKILTELRSLSFLDVGDIFNDDHSLKPISEWPKEVRRAIKEIQVEELFEGQGEAREQIGYAKKVKLTDKIKSIELMMKNLHMLTDRVELTGPGGAVLEKIIYVTKEQQEKVDKHIDDGTA